MNHSTVGTSYSSTVRLELIVGDQTFELAEIGPETVFLRKPVSIPPCEAEIVMHIDGRRRVWQVELPDGLSVDSPLAKTRPTASIKAPQSVELLQFP